jgi:hypothetical protein
VELHGRLEPSTVDQGHVLLPEQVVLAQDTTDRLQLYSNLWELLWTSEERWSAKPEEGTRSTPTDQPPVMRRPALR